jgi:photosystem II stability/assembly factor-like uncharacterized protein
MNCNSAIRNGRSSRLIWLSILCLSVMFSIGLHAESDAEYIVQGTAHDALFDADLVGDIGYAVGAKGKILRTEDGGATWASDLNPLSLALLSVSFNGERAVAVGQMGTVLIRDSSGEWRPVESGTKERLFSVDINSHGFAVASGSFGTFLRSVDGGETWKKVTQNWGGIFFDPDMRLGGLFEPNLYGAFVSESGEAWVVGELALVLKSSDQGETWSVENAGGSSEAEVSSTLSAINVRDDGVAYAVGQEGFVLKRDADDTPWRELKASSHQNLLGVTSTADGLVVAPGMRTILFSRDDGESWNAVRGLDIQSGWYSAAVISKKHSATFIFGNNANILTIK